MKNINILKLKKFLASCVLGTMVFSNLGFIENTFAIVVGPSFTASQTQANVNPVSEVKASRTLTVNFRPGNGDNIVVGNCTITFNSTDEFDCSNGSASIDRGSVLTSASTIAGKLRSSIINISDTVHGNLSIGGSGTNVIFTTSGSETSATNISFVNSTNNPPFGNSISLSSSTAGVVGVNALPQIYTFTPGSTVVSGVKYRATINATNYDFTSTGGTTLSGVLNSLKPLMDASSAVSCVNDTIKITCTATPTGSTFTANAQIIDVEGPVLTLNGSGTVTVERLSTYTDSGASYVDNIDVSGTVATAFSGVVNTNVNGNYTLQYKKVDTALNTSNIVTRTVTVVDTTPPVANVTYSTTSPTNQDVIATVHLSETGTITMNGGSNTHTFTNNSSLTFTYVDLYGNTGSIVATVNNIDRVKPTGTIIYIASGATNQNVLATLTLSETGTVTNNSSSIYHTFVDNGTFTFDFVDLAGNTGSTTAIVSGIDREAPTLLLNGSGTIDLEVHSTYNELGADWTDNVDGTGNISPFNGSVNPDVIGIYVLEYKYIDTASNVSNTVSRTVNVVDTTPPVITLNGNSTVGLYFGVPYFESGATWSDNFDGTGEVSTISGSVNVNAIGAYILEYIFTDSHSNTASKTRTVNVIDVTAPLLTLNGSGTINLEIGSTYNELGADWTDDVDLTGTVLIPFSGSVDTNTLGTYTLQYKKIDSSLNESNIENRIVNIVDTTAPVLTLNGDEIVTVERLTNYTESGADWTDNVDGTGTVTETSSGSVDTNNTGSYILEYNYTDSSENISNTVSRTVNVVDTKSPTGVIVSYSITGATNQDVIATLSGSNETITGTLVHTFTGNTSYNFEYSDLYGNTGSIDGTVTWIDKTAPTIVLNGNASVSLVKGTSYTELGATWTDDESTGSVNPFTGGVDTNTVGTYTLQYKKLDAVGNVSNIVTRTVNITQNTTSGGGGGGGGGFYYNPSTNSGTTNSGSTNSGTTNPIKLNKFDVKKTIEATGLDSTGTVSTGSNCINNTNITNNITFSDISNSFAKLHIEGIASKGVAQGYGNSEFRPNNKATRVEFLKMVLLAKSINYCDSNLSNITFTDVNKGNWEARVISKAISLGYIDASNKNFRPTDTITRAEAIKLIIKATGSDLTGITGNTSFSDVVVDWMKIYVKKALELNIISKNDKFRPLDSITRAEVAKMVYNAIVKGK